ncbi:MAG: hypothetical protein LBQ87_08410 [Candidatus Fibromonas sp.]|jgi:hypothetical protein|nr:hypothetical protein [Candidatus Fibromonas sp.]
MSKLAKITALIFGFAFNQSVAADVCDFEYSGDYYARNLERSTWIECGYDPYENLKVNESKTDERTYPDGSKIVTVYTLLGDKCFKTSEMGFDSTGSLIGSYSYVKKHHHVLQVTSGDVIVNINYGDTPCNFSAVEVSGRSTAFNFSGSGDDPEYEKLERIFPKVIAMLMRGQGYECQKYKEYKGYISQFDTEWPWK